jgi:hypothetical protein
MSKKLYIVTFLVDVQELTPSANVIHEMLCKAIYEENLDLIQQHKGWIEDIEVTEVPLPGLTEG